MGTRSVGGVVIVTSRGGVGVSGSDVVKSPKEVGVVLTLKRVDRCCLALWHWG